MDIQFSINIPGEQSFLWLSEETSFLALALICVGHFIACWYNTMAEKNLTPLVSFCGVAFYEDQSAST